MYGKIFASMFTGSMVGSGALTFAVMSYVIANMTPDKEVGAQVELNPKLLAAILGESEEDVSKVIEALCSPDPSSRTEGEDGRRLVRLGQFDYRVVNGAKYRAIRDEEQRREQNRQAQARRRAKLKMKKSKPITGEAAYMRAAGAGVADEDLDKLSDPDRLRENGTEYHV